jgi:multisubunit Na+/H+ antiporter MnhE subunit
MLWTIFAILLVLWLLGSGAIDFVHSLLALAVGVLLIRIIEGRSPELGRKRPSFFIMRCM